MTPIDQTIAACYIAFFGRSPDQQGLQFWQNGANTSGLSELALAANIAQGFVDNPSFKTTYGGMDNTAFVNAIYQNIAGTAPEQDGLHYWTHLLDTGTSQADVVAQFVYGVLNMTQDAINAEVAAGTITQAEADNAHQRTLYLSNHAEVALAYTSAMGAGSNMAPGTDQSSLASLMNDSAYVASQAILNGVTADPSSVAAAEVYLNGAPTNGDIIAQFGGSTVQGHVYTLTPNVDNFTGDAAGNNTFYAVVNDGTGATTTLNAGDVIDGGTGTNNTLEIVTTGALIATGIDLAAESITHVQNLVINSADGMIGRDGIGAINLADDAFTSVRLVAPAYVTVQGINEGTSAIVQAGAVGTSTGFATFHFDATTAASVTMNDTAVGTTGLTGYVDANFIHGDTGAGLANATTINATLNVQDVSTAGGAGQVMGNQYIYAENAGNKGAVINVNVNVTSQPGGDSNLYDATTYVYQSGDAAVTANINMTNASGEAAVEASADQSITPDRTKNIANVTLNNVSSRGGPTGVGVGDFDTVNVNVTGNSTLNDGLSFTENQWTATPLNSQTVTITASADLMSGSTTLDRVGTTHLTLTGTGSMYLGNYSAGGGATPDDTFTSTIDASAMKGNLTVVLASPISSFAGGSGNNALLSSDGTNGSLVNNATIDGGVGGTNTIAAALLANSPTATFTDFQIVDVSGYTGVLDTSLTGLSFTGVSISTASAAGATLQNLTADVTVTDSHDGDNSSLALSHVGATGTLAVNFADTVASGTQTLAITSAGDTGITVVSGGAKGDVNALSITEHDNHLASVTVSGANALTLSLALDSSDTAVTLVTSALTNIDASQTTGGVTITSLTTGGAATYAFSGLTVHGGTGGDAILLGTNVTGGMIVEGATAANSTTATAINTLTVAGSGSMIDDTASHSNDVINLNGFSDIAKLGSGGTADTAVKVNVADDTFATDGSGGARLGDTVQVTFGSGVASVNDSLHYNVASGNGDMLVLHGSLSGNTLAFTGVTLADGTLGAASGLGYVSNASFSSAVAAGQSYFPSTVEWFQYQGNTYIEESGWGLFSGTTHTHLVKIVGLVDLSAATISGNAIHFA